MWNVVIVLSNYDGQDLAYQEQLEEIVCLEKQVWVLCGIIDCYLMGSETLEKIDVSARKLLAEVGYARQDNS